MLDRKFKYNMSIVPQTCSEKKKKVLRFFTSRGFFRPVKMVDSTVMDSNLELKGRGEGGGIV